MPIIYNNRDKTKKNRSAWNGRKYKTKTKDSWNMESGCTVQLGSFHFLVISLSGGCTQSWSLQVAVKSKSNFQVFLPCPGNNGVKGIWSNSRSQLDNIWPSKFLYTALLKKPIIKAILRSPRARSPSQHCWEIFWPHHTLPAQMEVLLFINSIIIPQQAVGEPLYLGSWGRTGSCCLQKADQVLTPIFKQDI